MSLCHERWVAHFAIFITLHMGGSIITVVEPSFFIAGGSLRSSFREGWPLFLCRPSKNRKRPGADKVHKLTSRALPLPDSKTLMGLKSNSQ